MQELQPWEIHKPSKTSREFVQVMHTDRYSFTSIQRFLAAGGRSDHYFLYLNQEIFLWGISQNLLKAVVSNGKTPIVFNRSSSWKEKKACGPSVCFTSNSYQFCLMSSATAGELDEVWQKRLCSKFPLPSTASVKHNISRHLAAC